MLYWFSWMAWSKLCLFFFWSARACWSPRIVAFVLVLLDEDAYRICSIRGWWCPRTNVWVQSCCGIGNHSSAWSAFWLEGLFFFLPSVFPLGNLFDWDFLCVVVNLHVFNKASKRQEPTTNNQKQSAAVQVSSQHWKTHRRSLYHLSRVDPDLIALSQNQMQGRNQFYNIYQEQLVSYANWRRLQYRRTHLFT